MAWEADTIPVPASVRFPVELALPQGFDPSDPATWPDVEGRLEYVVGRLLYLPHCGLMQQAAAVDATYVVRGWAEDHREFFVGGLEAGMLLGGDTRGADLAVWRRDSLARIDRKYARVTPILAVEVEGEYEGEAQLREKARWYLSRGVEVVWIVLPSSREVVVVRPDAESRHATGDRLPSHPSLPGLAPAVDRFFAQLD